MVVLCSDVASNVTGAAWSVDGGTVPIIHLATEGRHWRRERELTA